MNIEIKHLWLHKCPKKWNQYTLIALVITIIVLLILAGISISMLTGDNSIISKATDAKTKTERQSVVEQARTDVLGYQAENKGGDLDKTQLKSVLDKYFDEVPNLTDMEKDTILNTELNTLAKYGTHTIAVYEIYNGDLKQEIKETYITKSTEKEDSYVGYYADIDNDGTVDGIIYADMLIGNTGSGRWNNDTYGWASYDITKIDEENTVKDYVVSSWTYAGQSDPGIYKANNGFGVNEVLVPASSTEGTEDRFYVMTLSDFTSDSKTLFYWYYKAYDAESLNRNVLPTTNDFGYGKENTINMLDDWNTKTSTYGSQTTTGTYIDLWGAIQDGQYNLVQATGDNSKKWFIPSKSEWSAFGEELGIYPSNYLDFGLSVNYWSSSQNGYCNAYCANTEGGYMTYDGVAASYCVRLSTSF